jgi:hypothetical protein
VKHTDKKFALAYLLLVILPISGLAVLLRRERNLVAPNSIGGQWKVQSGAEKFADLPCGKSLTAVGKDAGFSISQSGKTFTMSVGNAATASTSGEIDGTTVKAWISPAGGWAKEAGCGDGRMLSMTAALDPNAAPRTLRGSLSVNDCPTCAAFEFYAVREDQAKGGGAR